MYEVNSLANIITFCDAIRGLDESSQASMILIDLIQKQARMGIYYFDKKASEPDLFWHDAIKQYEAEHGD